MRYNIARLRKFATKGIELPDPIESLKGQLRSVQHRIEANQPGTSAWRLSELANSDDFEVRRRVASHVSTPLSVLLALFKDSDGAVRGRVAMNMRTPFEISAALARDEDPDVSLSLFEVFCLHDEILRTLTLDENPFVREQARRAHEAIELERLLAHHQFFESHEVDYFMGEIVVAAGLVREPQMMRVLESAARWELKTGQALVRSGRLSGETAALVLNLQKQLRGGLIDMERAIRLLGTVKEAND